MIHNIQPFTQSKKKKHFEKSEKALKHIPWSIMNDVIKSEKMVQYKTAIEFKYKMAYIWSILLDIPPYTYL